ncbi:MAG: hypothetical protein PHO93_02955 [Candidatus Saccharimonadaceae bacterium]|nr:hypothetical protein [Candidatus Saccharimonadaceae bacterium]
MCRNYYKAIIDKSAELCEFLEQFGIDIAKPIETWSSHAYKAEKLADYVSYYAVNGFIKSIGGYEIDIGTVQIIVNVPNKYDVIHCPEFIITTEFLEPYFIFEIHNLLLPWVVNEDINEFYPERVTLFNRLKTFFKIR